MALKSASFEPVGGAKQDVVDAKAFEPHGEEDGDGGGEDGGNNYYCDEMATERTKDNAEARREKAVEQIDL